MDVDRIGLLSSQPQPRVSARGGWQLALSARYTPMSTLVGPTASAAAWTGCLGFGALSVSPVLSHGCRSPRLPNPLKLPVPEYLILSLVRCSIVERTSRRSYRSFQPSPLSRFERPLCTGRPRGLDGTFILTATLHQPTADGPSRLRCRAARLACRKAAML